MNLNHRFDQKMYKVTRSDNSFFVIAYSKVHAIVEIVNNNIKNGIGDYAGEYDIENVSKVTKKEMKDIVIDYNYVKNIVQQESLYKAFKELTKYKEGESDFYGVVSDDFVDYN